MPDKSTSPSSPVWTLSFACGSWERSLRIEAATCSIERGDRYVFRDRNGNWIAEIAQAAVIEGPRIANDKQTEHE